MSNEWAKALATDMANLARLERMVTHRPEVVCIGAQGAPPPEPPKGMNGPTGAPVDGAPMWPNRTAMGAENWRELVRVCNIAAPEIPVTDEQWRAGYSRDAEMERSVGVGILSEQYYFTEIYRAMRAKEPTSYDECTIESLRSQLTDALAGAEEWKTDAEEYARWADEADTRAQAAEEDLAVMKTDCLAWQSMYRTALARAEKAETRLAERDASFNRLRWRP